MGTSTSHKFRYGPPSSRDMWQMLTGLRGATIGAICPNGYDDPDASHCAHFVSVLGYDFGCTCQELTGGFGPGACVRVHEIFEHCARVGPWKNRLDRSPCLAFVCRPTAFDFTSKKLLNIPNKHIGIFCNNYVFHYSSRQKAVVLKNVLAFVKYLEEIYGDKQLLAFGSLERPPATRSTLWRVHGHRIER